MENAWMLILEVMIMLYRKDFGPIIHEGLPFDLREASMSKKLHESVILLCQLMLCLL
jgi:hypothetical protein